MQGTITLFDTETGKVLFSKSNQIQNSYKTIMYNLLAGNTSYTIGYMYIEYKNVSSPTEDIPAPAFTADDGVEYYTSLAGTTDYLRIPIMITPTITTDGVTFTGIVSATEGMHGVPFNAVNNSKVYGLALVAAPGDTSQDVICSRSYWDADKQKIVDSAVQLGISWKLTL